jgi:hypothetical protein
MCGKNCLHCTEGCSGSSCQFDISGHWVWENTPTTQDAADLTQTGPTSFDMLYRGTTFGGGTISGNQAHIDLSALVTDPPGCCTGTIQNPTADTGRAKNIQWPELVNANGNFSPPLTWHR